MAESSNKFINFGNVNGANNIGVRTWMNGEVSNFGNIHGGFWGVVQREGGNSLFNAGTITGDTGVYMGGLGLDSSGNEVNNTGELARTALAHGLGCDATDIGLAAQDEGLDWHTLR